MEHACGVDGAGYVLDEAVACGVDGEVFFVVEEGADGDFGVCFYEVCLGVVAVFRGVEELDVAGEVGLDVQEGLGELVEEGLVAAGALFDVCFEAFFEEVEDGGFACYVFDEGGAVAGKEVEAAVFDVGGFCGDALECACGGGFLLLTLWCGCGALFVDILITYV